MGKSCLSSNLSDTGTNGRHDRFLPTDYQRNVKLFPETKTNQGSEKTDHHTQPIGIAKQCSKLTSQFSRRFKEEQMRKKLILARNKNEAAYYAKLKGLSPEEWEFVVNEDCFSEMYGKDFDFIITGSADKRDDFSQLCKIATELSFIK